MTNNLFISWMKLFCILICIYVVKALWKAWIYHESSLYAHPMKPEWLYLWKPVHRYGIPWEICFHTDEIPTEDLSTGWLTPGKDHSIGRLYLRNVSAYVRYTCGNVFHMDTIGIDFATSIRSIPTACSPCVIPIANPMETPKELRLY